MPLLLPILALGAAALYFLARHEGWLEAIARRPGRRGGPHPRRPDQSPKLPPGSDAAEDRERLAVFEEFLGGLSPDDGEGSEKPQG